jgi:hypothetical protein
MNDAKFLLILSAFSEYGVNTGSSLCFVLEFFTCTKFKREQRTQSCTLLCCVRCNQYKPSPLIYRFVQSWLKNNMFPHCNTSQVDDI